MNCEDRAILFTRIVRDLLGLKCILIYYPGHLASAVFRTLSAALAYQLSLHYITWQKYSHTLSTMSWRFL